MMIRRNKYRESDKESLNGEIKLAEKSYIMKCRIEKFNFGRLIGHDDDILRLKYAIKTPI